MVGPQTEWLKPLRGKSQRFFADVFNWATKYIATIARIPADELKSAGFFIFTDGDVIPPIADRLRTATKQLVESTYLLFSVK